MEIKKINIKEIEKIDITDLSSKNDNTSVVIGTSRLEDVVIKNGDLIDVNLDYNNGWDKKCNGLTPDARKKYIEADKLYFQKTNTNMTIHISKRTVAKQAELYIKYKYHKEGNKVAWPGCSFHNWGLAIEMQSTNKKLVSKVMKKNAWSKTLKSDALYFECTGSRDHNKAAMVIKSFRTNKTGLAFKWSEQVDEYYKKTKVLKQRVPIYNNKLEENKTFSQKINSERNLFKIEMQSFKNQVDTYNKDVNQFNIELIKTNKLYDSTLRTHIKRKKEKQIIQYNILIEKINIELLRLSKNLKEIDKIDFNVTNENAKINLKLNDFRRNEKWLNNEHKYLVKLISEIEKHKSNATLHLQSIDGQTWK